MSLTSILAKRIADYDNRQSAGSKLRTRRIAPLLQMIDRLSTEHGHVDIIDIGGTETYWNLVPRDYLASRNVNITIVNLPGAVMPEDHGPFKFVEADGCNLASFGDRTFHIAHSNSVIEHVGDWQRMVLFASEISRVADMYFVQTPNYWFPLEPHFMTPLFHWLPKPTRIWLVLHFQLGHWSKAVSVDEAVRAVESVHLLNKPMFRELFKDARIVTEWFLCMPKSFVAIRDLGPTSRT